MPVQSLESHHLNQGDLLESAHHQVKVNGEPLGVIKSVLYLNCDSHYIAIFVWQKLIEFNTKRDGLHYM